MTHFEKLSFCSEVTINPFLANVFILYPLQTRVDLRFSGVSKGYKMSDGSCHAALKAYISNIPHRDSFDIFLSFSKLWIHFKLKSTLLSWKAFFSLKERSGKSSTIKNFEQLLETEYCCFPDKILFFLSTFPATFLSMSTVWKVDLKIKILEKIIKMIELFDF